MFTASAHDEAKSLARWALNMAKLRHLEMLGDSEHIIIYLWWRRSTGTYSIPPEAAESSNDHLFSGFLPIAKDGYTRLLQNKR